jgi:hypothetical protein
MPSKLQLFLARKGDGTWLESSTDDVKELKKEEKTALIEALTHEDNELQGESGLQKVLKDMPLVVLALSQPSLFWKEPKSLVATTGANWDFQNSLDLGNLASAIGRHYKAWRDGKTDKQSHPLFVCLDGPATGKSRLLAMSCSSKSFAARRKAIQR